MSVLAREPRTLRFERYLMDVALHRWKLTPLRITLVYLVFGLLALYFSDVYLVQRFSDPLLGQLQAMKGGLEVLLTGGLIFGLTMTKEAQVKHSNERNERQREELLVLHRVLRHNLRNDLNVIMGVSEMFTSEALDEEDRHRSSVLRDTARRMLHYTEQAARIRRVTAHNGDEVRVDLADIVPNILDRSPRPIDDIEVDYDLPDSAIVRVNHMFEDAIAELLENAIEHNDSASPRIEISVDPAAGPLHHVELRIADNGPGIPHQVVSILQEAETDQLTHLQGMGLWFVYWVVSESGGHLVIDGADDGGAVVRVRVPSASVITKQRLDEVIDSGIQPTV